MADAKWRMRGQYMKNCNCIAACPCDTTGFPYPGKGCEGETMPAVTVSEREKGLPMAMTQSPTCAPSELPSLTVGRGWAASILITAMAVSGSVCGSPNNLCSRWAEVFQFPANPAPARHSR